MEDYPSLSLENCYWRRGFGLCLRTELGRIKIIKSKGTTVLVGQGPLQRLEKGPKLECSWNCSNGWWQFQHRGRESHSSSSMTGRGNHTSQAKMSKKWSLSSWDWWGSQFRAGRNDFKTWDTYPLFSSTMLWVEGVRNEGAIASKQVPEWRLSKTGVGKNRQEQWWKDIKLHEGREKGTRTSSCILQQAKDRTKTVLLQPRRKEITQEQHTIITLEDRHKCGNHDRDYRAPKGMHSPVRQQTSC